ncbi:GGDEF domain-containing protein [Rhizobium sp. CFBP 8752]|uniref:GGDEF domain-containing protein n=1 Tax=Rhizobium sp. CFBP 8752 TaxID=2775301 RepID=UPI001783647B|nr:GGDEF domain-containing protein [Rhizobium sp. CFBP 8752]MBD8663620.1 GGDEF domain-containing protein [Rhizobium sp. CFBP 8752]
MSADNARQSRDRSLAVVAQQMAKQDVAGLPRNYTLFHEALSGSDPALTRDVATLPAGATQAQIDEIGLRYQLPGFVVLSIANRDEETRRVLDLVGTIAQATLKKQNFVRALETAAESLRSGSASGLADIQAELDHLQANLSETLSAEIGLTKSLELAADRLLMSSNLAEAARTNSLSDRLTGLPNHVALAEKLDLLYAPAAEHRAAALFVVRLVDLGELAQTYGQVTAGRIVKRAAAIFRKAIKKNDFLARTATDSFAFLFEDVDRSGAKAIADRLVTSIADSLVFAGSGEGHYPHMRLSIGVALSTEAFSPQQIKLHAATALESLRVHGSGAGTETVAIFGDPSRRVS